MFRNVQEFLEAKIKFETLRWNHSDLWIEYQKRAIRKEPCKDFDRGAGYYFVTGIMTYNPIDDPKLQDFHLPMKSGKVATLKLLEYHLFSDPDDMIKESW